MLTSRRLLIAAAGLVVISTGTFLLSQDATQKLQEQDQLLRLPNTPALAIDANADELTRLRIERRNAAIASLSATTQLCLGGRGDVEAIANSSAQRALTAQLDTPGADRMAILKDHVDFARALEKVMKERYSSGVADAAQLNAIKYWRLETEILLAREKQAK